MYMCKKWCFNIVCLKYVFKPICPFYLCSLERVWCPF